ncbi:hypothetical protein SLURMMXVI_120024 [Escherichia phage vB_Eco_SLUR76]|nr:hypothetical protein SLURMMXVI_120024 [Escherichia phage vB_Eco_SLUR76]VAY28083.1 hypothetical protein SLURMMXVI_30024 [Escherichia phage vB_Eco_SLUR26]
MSNIEDKKAAAAAAAAAAAKSAKTAKKEATANDAEAKKAAAAEAARVAKEKKEAEKKAAAEKKQAEIRIEAENKFTALSQAVETVKFALSGITDESTVEQITEAESKGSEQLKHLKNALKELKAVVKKSKGEDLSGAVTAAQSMVDELDSSIKGFKDKIRAAKQAEKAAEKAREKAEREKAKEANRMPEQNGVRRPQPETSCGRAWALMDQISATLGQPAPISYVLNLAGRHGLNEDTVKTQYARWKKFNGVTGRVPMPVPEALNGL